MPILPLNYDQIAQAAVAAALQLTNEIDPVSYTDVGSGGNLDPFMLARRKAENIGHLTTTILETMRRRNESVFNLQDGPPPCGSAATSY